MTTLAQDLTSIDFAASAAAAHEDRTEQMKLVSEKKQPFEALLDWWKLSRGFGNITFNEYVLYGLYDDERFDPTAKSKFLNDKFHWPVTNLVNPVDWKGVAEDKFIASTFLEGAGIRVPETVAVIDKGHRQYGKVEKVSDGEQLMQVLRSVGTFPLIAKINGGIASFGILAIEGVDEDLIHLVGRPPMTAQNFMDELVGDECYLLQKCVTNHADLAKMSPWCSTVRITTMVHNKAIHQMGALLKLPRGANIADNYWRPGNITCDIDMKTGKILRAVSGRFSNFQVYEKHPDTGENLIGMKLPFWEEVRETARACTALTTPMKYQSSDIAITPSGPSVVEVNYGSGYLLHQLVSGKGWLTREFIDLAESHGYRFKGKRP